MGRTRRQRLRKRKKVVNDVNYDFSVKELGKLMKIFGWRNNTSLRIASFPGTGRGVMSKKQINRDDTLIEIPFELMITFIVVEKCAFVQALLHDSATKFTIHDLLSLYLIFEIHLKKYSCWYSYIQSLPTMDTINIIWLSTDEELSHMNDELLSQVNEERSNFAESWSRVQSLSQSQYTCQHCGARVNTILTHDLYLWAYILINTRAVYIDPIKIRQISQTDLIHKLVDEPSMALCPFLDMFNHSSDTSTTAALINVNGFIKYRLVTRTKFKKYDQVFISYGTHSNEKLLCQYGFVLFENESDKVKFTIKEILTVLKIEATNRQYKYLCQHQLLEEIFVDYNGCSFNMNAVLYVLSCVQENNWSLRIYTTEYSKEQLCTTYLLTKILLEWKLLQCNSELEEISGRTSCSRHFNTYFSYMEMRICFIKNILNDVIKCEL